MDTRYDFDRYSLQHILDRNPSKDISLNFFSIFLTTSTELTNVHDPLENLIPYLGFKRFNASSIMLFHFLCAFSFIFMNFFDQSVHAVIYFQWQLSTYLLVISHFKLFSQHCWSRQWFCIGYLLESKTIFSVVLNNHPSYDGRGLIKLSKCQDFKLYNYKHHLNRVLKNSYRN